MMKKSTILIASVGALAIFGFSAAASYSFARPHDGQGMRGHGGGHMCPHKGRHGGKSHHGRGHHRMKYVMEHFDTNGDSKLTQEEIDSAIKAKLDSADSDKDGALTLDEFQTVWLEMMRKRMVRRFQHLDEDGDAKVTLTEAQKPFAKIVERRDRNGDGVLDKEDRRRKGGWKHRKGGPDGGRGPKGSEGGSPE